MANLYFTIVIIKSQDKWVMASNNCFEANPATFHTLERMFGKIDGLIFINSY